MTTIALTAYVLVWPIVVAGVMIVIGRAFGKEIRDAKREGRDII